MVIEEIEKILHSLKIKDHSKDKINELFNSLKSIKAEYVGRNDQDGAKKIWCLEQILKIQTDYVHAFNLLKTKKYYEAWKIFEQIEINLNFLNPHFNTNNDEYFLKFIRTKVKKFQSLFPYKLFFSPEIIEHEKKCNICGKIISIRNPCGHEVGEIYNGEMCIRIVTKAEFIGISLVESPLQKYSVPFMSDPKTGKTVDHYNYSLLENLLKILKSPFDEWDYKKTQKMYPHSKFKHIGRNEKCPCGSGKKYKQCCLKREGVTLPHYEFLLPEPLLKGRTIGDIII